ncbi:MAG: fimbria major subunit [Muribaculaceae bacterium]|nr:fimbria major subunit [Muribaculaceae bacterium]
MKLKVSHIALAFFSSAMLLLQGCIFDDMGVCPQEVLPANTIGYLSLKLLPTDDATRAAVGEQYEYGKFDEFALAPGECHYVIFYDGEHEGPVAASPLSGIAMSELPDRKANSTVAFAAIVAKSEQKGWFENLKECFVLLNTPFELADLLTVSKDELLQKIVNTPYISDGNGTRYLTMCNSVYVEGGGKTSVAAKVDPTKVFTSQLEAMEKALKGEAAVVAYVERVAAKVSLRFENEKYDEPSAERVFTPDNDEVVLFSRMYNDVPYYEGGYSSRIRITGWGMNALEKKSFLFRKFDPAVNYFSGWYNTANSRVFWSEDMNYNYSSAYPWQYRKAVNSPSVPYYKNKINGSENTNILQNISFSGLANGKFGKDNALYVPENTYDFTDAAFKNLDSRPELLAGTHVIVCAELLTNIDNRNVFSARDLYRDRNGNYYRTERDCFKALVLAFNNSVISHSFLRFRYYDWDNGGGEQTLFAMTKGEYNLYYGNTKLDEKNIDALAGMLTSDATVVGGDGQRLAWLDGMTIKDGNGNVVDIYTNIDEVDSSKNRYLRKATPNDIKSILLEYIGVIDHFKDGKMYYAVPVGFLLDNDKSTPTNSTYSIYGVVRNCSYDILIHNVTGLGTSVDNVEEPIVPNKVMTHDHLFISIEILRWHETSQNVPGVIT